MTRVVYAGISITVDPVLIAGSHVLVIDATVRRPVFHRAVGYAPLCGRTADVDTLVIPFKHARRFARPCLRCWPELRGQPELELKEAPL